jgi:hypothetical protein
VKITGKIRSMVATLSIAGVLVLAACDAGGGGGGTTNTNKSNDQLLKDAAKNMRELKSYTIDAKIETQGMNIVMKADLEGLDGNEKKSRMDMDALGIKAQIITIGDKAYMSTDAGANFTDASGQSAQMTGSIDSLANMWDSLTDAEIDKAKDQLKDGSPATETIDGTPTKHITGDLKALSALGAATGGGANEGTMDLWITTDGTNYVRRMAIDSTQSGQAVKGTIDWMNFNKGFDIKAP